MLFEKKKKGEEILILTPNNFHGILNGCNPYNNYEKFEKSRSILLVDTQEILRAFVFLKNSVVEKEGKGFICTLFYPDLAKYNILSLTPRSLLERRSPVHKDAWWWIRQGQVAAE